MLLPRRRVVPEQVRAVALPPGDRRLAWGLTTAGEPVVAAELALHLPGAAPLPWTEVERVSWRRPVLEVLRVAQVEGSGERWSFEVEQEHLLAEVVRAQVTASVAWSNHLSLPTGGVRIVGRRRPGRDALDWQLVYDAGTDLDDPAVRAQAESALQDARRTLG